MAPRKSSSTGPTRFVGANIPLELAQVFDDARGERGVATISEALILAIGLWVEHNPPSGGIGRALADLISQTRMTRAMREGLDAALIEWRNSGSQSVLKKIADLATKAPDLKLPKDVETAIAALSKTKGSKP